MFRDLEAVRQIPVVPQMLEVICQVTGMGFAAIARVTEDRWLACSVRDEVNFGLKEGGELKVETTLCHEVKGQCQLIVIDDVDQDSQYRDHHTPRIYGLKSYISVPIILKDGTFFGTLCAINAKPAQLNNSKVIHLFTMFADLLSFHLQSLELLERSQRENRELLDQNKTLTNTNFDLDSFVYTASHDLKSHLANIEGLLDAFTEELEKEELDPDELRQIVAVMRSSLQRFTNTIRSLVTVIEADQDSEPGATEAVNLQQLVEDAKLDLAHLIHESRARIEVSSGGSLLPGFAPKNLRSIVHNLLSNALKYRSPERVPEVLVQANQVDGRTHLSVTDNGLGIPKDKKDKVFTMFKRLHDHVEGSGLGLYIVKRMVDNAGGEIQVSSTLDEGTTFTVIL